MAEMRARQAEAFNQMEVSSDEDEAMIRGEYPTNPWNLPFAQPAKPLENSRGCLHDLMSIMYHPFSLWNMTLDLIADGTNEAAECALCSLDERSEKLGMVVGPCPPINV